MSVRIWFLLTTMGFVALNGCKQRQDYSAAKDESDIQPGQIQWVATEGKWAITCREGRLHNGSRSALVSSRDLRNACEENDPGYGNNGGNNGGGSIGGGNNGGGTNLWGVEGMCPNRAQITHQVSFALAPEYTQQLTAMQPAVARQRLCVGFVSRFAQIMQSSPTLVQTLTGETTGSPILVMITTEDQPIEFDGGAFLLQMPARITDETVDQLSDAFDGANINLCGDGFRRVLRACWIVTENQDENCTQACERMNQRYDEKTATVAGWPGGEDGCRAVGQAFGVGYTRQNPYCSSTVGCVSWNNRESAICSSGGQATGANNAASRIYNAAGQSVGNGYRFCACKS